MCVCTTYIYIDIYIYIFVYIVIYDHENGYIMCILYISSCPLVTGTLRTQGRHSAPILRVWP